MTNTLADIPSFMPITELSPFNLFQLQCILDITVPQVKLKPTGTITPETYKSLFIYKERNRLNFPESVSPRVLHYLNSSVLEANPLEIPTETIYNYCKYQLPNYHPLETQYWTVSLITFLNYFNFKTKPQITTFLATLAYESKRFTKLSGYKYYKRAYKEPYQLYQPKGYIKFTTKEMYEYYNSKSIIPLDIVENPKLLLNPVIALYYACLYWQINQLDKPADDLNFRSIVKHFDPSYDSWTPRYRLWNKTANHLKF